MAAPERDASWRCVQVSSKCSLEEQRAELALCHRTLSARPALVSRRSSRHSLQLLQQRPNPALRLHHQAPAYRLPRAGVHCTRCCAPCPPPTPHSLGRSCHEGSGRTEFFFFPVCNILSFDLSPERGLQTDSQGILASKDAAGQSGFPEAARLHL